MTPEAPDNEVPKEADLPAQAPSLPLRHATGWQSAQRRTQAARIAALTRWAHEDAREGTKAAHAGFDARFLREVDPHKLLTEAERRVRADRAKRAYMQRLALRSAQSRSRRRG